MSFLIPLLYFIFANGFFVLIFKKSFGKCIPFTMMVCAFTYFFSQVLFSTFKIGFFLNLSYAFLFFLLLFLKKKEKKEIKENLFSRGFYAFLILYCILFFFDLNRSFEAWDEYSHWGEMVKEMFRLDQFYSISKSSLQAHKDYPPIMQLLELFFCMLKGGFKESYLVQCMHLFSFSFFIPIIDKKDFPFKKSFVIKVVLTLLSFYLILLSFDQHGIINTIYTDYIMAIIVSYLLFYIFSEKELLSSFSLLLLSIGCSFLVLLKQIGLTLYLMIFFFFFFDIILKRKTMIKEVLRWKNIKNVLKVCFLLIVIPLLLWQGWSHYVQSLHTEQQFKLSDLKIEELGGILKGEIGEEYQKQAAFNYMDAIKTKTMTTTYLSFTYSQCIVLALFLLYLLYFWSKKRKNKNEFLLSGITLVIGAFGYMFVMFVLYVFSFGPTEGPALASFNRYLPTYILVMMLFVFFLFLLIDQEKEKEKISLKNITILCTVLFLLQYPASLQRLVPKIEKKEETVFEHHAKIISKQTKKNDKIFIIAQNTDGAFQFYTKYYMSPRIVNLHNFNLPCDQKNMELYFKKEVEADLEKFDYLYLAVIDDNFIHHYKFLFPNNDMKEGQLYRIKKEEKKIKLILV